MEPESIARALAGVQAVWTQTTRAMGLDIAGHRLTVATIQAIQAIDPAAAPPSMRVMAERLHCNASNLTFIMDQLVERGLAVRETDPTDRRSRVVVLTPEGLRVRKAIEVSAIENTPLATLTQAELDQLAALLLRALDS